MRGRTPQALLALAVTAFLGAWLLIDVPPLSTLRTWSDATGAWFPLLFFVLYVVVTQFPIPRTIMTISAGVLFGTVEGVVLALTATTVSAVISLLVVRFLLRDWVEPRLTHPKLQAVNARLEERGWLAVLSLRMIAAVPFSVLNYAAALTRVRVAPFALATLVGSAPGTVLVAVFGDTLAGEAKPVYVAAMAVLACVGVFGLVVDTKLPARGRHVN